MTVTVTEIQEFLVVGGPMDGGFMTAVHHTIQIKNTDPLKKPEDPEYVSYKLHSLMTYRGKSYKIWSCLPEDEILERLLKGYLKTKADLTMLELQNILNNYETEVEDDPAPTPAPPREGIPVPNTPTPEPKLNPWEFWKRLGKEQPKLPDPPLGDGLNLQDWIKMDLKTPLPPMHHIDFQYIDPNPWLSPPEEGPNMQVPKKSPRNAGYIDKFVKKPRVNPAPDPHLIPDPQDSSPENSMELSHYLFTHMPKLMGYLVADYYGITEFSLNAIAGGQLAQLVTKIPFHFKLRLAIKRDASNPAKCYDCLKGCTAPMLRAAMKLVIPLDLGNVLDIDALHINQVIDALLCCPEEPVSKAVNSLIGKIS